MLLSMGLLLYDAYYMEITDSKIRGTTSCKFIENRNMITPLGELKRKLAYLGKTDVINVSAPLKGNFLCTSFHCFLGARGVYVFC